MPLFSVSLSRTNVLADSFTHSTLRYPFRSTCCANVTLSFIEHFPSLAVSSLNVVVAENTTVGSTIATLAPSANDTNRGVTFFLRGGGGTSEPFSLNDTTGEITLSAPLDFENGGPTDFVLLCGMRDGLYVNCFVLVFLSAPCATMCYSLHLFSNLE